MQVLLALANPTITGGWSSEQITLLKCLLPHIRQFVRVRQAVVGAGAMGASLAGLLDNMMIGVICPD